MLRQSPSPSAFRAMLARLLWHQYAVEPRRSAGTSRSRAGSKYRAALAREDSSVEFRGSGVAETWMWVLQFPLGAMTNECLRVEKTISRSVAQYHVAG